MSNPIVYSPQALTNALNKGYFYIGTKDVGKGPTSSTGYFDGVTPSNNQYVIYYYKDGSTKIYYCSNGDQVYVITNRLKSQNFTTLESALNYIATQGDMMCVNRQYEPIVTDGLVFNVDAGFVPSYPMTNTTWYDLTNNDNDGTLINGPTYNSSNGGVIIFDGIDDKVNAPSSSMYDFTYNQAFTLETFCYATTQSGSGMIPLIERYWWSTTGYGGYGLRLRNYSTNYPDFFVTGTPPGSGVLDSLVRGTTQWVPNTWYHIVGTKSTNGVMKIYVNGVLENTTQNVTNIPLPQTGVTLKIGARGDTNDQYSNQRFGICRIYSKELSATEVLQNYNAQKGRFGL
jgi:hypothetical protein